MTKTQTTVTLRVEEEETPKALEQKCWTEQRTAAPQEARRALKRQRQLKGKTSPVGKHTRACARVPRPE